MRDKSVKIRVSEGELTQMDAVVKLGDYKNLSDMVRDLVREKFERLAEKCDELK